jgi:hypothetical protein
LHDGFGYDLAVLLEGFGNPDDGDVTYDVVGFVEKLKLVRLKLVCKKSLEASPHLLGSSNESLLG